MKSRWSDGAPSGAITLVQEKGRSEILLDYHLRVGQVTRDTQVPAGHAIVEQRLDETETGKATTVTFIDARRPGGLSEQATAAETAACLGLDESTTGLVEWDVSDAVLTPGDLILMLAWRSKEDADPGSPSCRNADGSGRSG